MPIIYKKFINIFILFSSVLMFDKIPLQYQRLIKNIIIHIAPTKYENKLIDDICIGISFNIIFFNLITPNYILKYSIINYRFK